MTNKEQALVSKGYDKDTVISLCRYNNEDLIDIVDTFINIITKNDYIDEYLMFNATPKKIAIGINNILDSYTHNKNI